MGLRQKDLNKTNKKPKHKNIVLVSETNKSNSKKSNNLKISSSNPINPKSNEE
jgi:hypothetical protein